MALSDNHYRRRYMYTWSSHIQHAGQAAARDIPVPLTSLRISIDGDATFFTT
jgi:hypothetical protein